MANPKKALEELQKKYGVTPTKKEISPVSQATKPATTGDRDKKTTTNNTQSTTTGTKTRAKSAMDDLRKKYQENPGAWASKAEERKAEREKQYGTYDGATGTRKTEQQNDSTLWDVAKSSASSGMWQFNNAVASTLDFVLPTEFMGKADLPSRFSEWTQKNYEQAEKTRAANLSGRSKAAEVASDLGVGVVSAIPNAILAFMSAGASVPAQLGMTAAGTGLTMAVSNAATSMVKNPMYWSSVMQTLGPSYDEAKRNGASDLEAAVTAIVSTGINAGIETAGGLEKLPGELAEEGGSALLKWVQSMGEEGLEEVLQGIASGATAKVGYDHDKPLFSTGFEPEKKMMEEIGQYGAGNVDLYSRPATSNADGSWSTVAGMSFNIDGKEVLLPTVWTKDGQPYLSENPDEILQHYFETGEYLGIFDTVEEANAYAEKLHKAQEYYYSGKDDAIVNLAGMAEEFLMGAGVAGILGGGQVVGANMLNRMAGNNVSRDINIDVSQADPVMQAALEVVEAEQGVKQNVDGVNENVDTTTESTNRTTESTNRTTQEPAAIAPTQSQDGVLPADDKLPTRQKKTDRSRPAPNYGKYGTEAFDKIVSETGAEPAAVQRSFETFYQAGLADIPVEKMRFVNRNQEDAYFAGRRDYALSLGENKQKGANLQGEGILVENEASKNLDRSTRTQLQNWAKATNTTIIIDEALRGTDQNGYYQNGEIHISPDTDRPMLVVARHEITHHLQVAAPEAYAAFRNYAIQQMNDGLLPGNSTITERMQERYGESDVELDTEGAMDEVAAHFAEHILGDEKAMHTFIEEVSGNADTRSWAQKFFDSVRAFVDKVKKAFGKGKQADQAVLDEYGVTIEQFEKAEQLWKDAVKAASAKTEQKAAQETKADTQKDEDGAKFSLKTPVEQTKTLIALHNLTTDKLLKALKLGGFPMPSIAVTKSDIPHTNFGDITLVMDKRTVDPKASKKNTVYSADAWTPTFPKVDYEVNRDVEYGIYDKAAAAAGSIPADYLSTVRRMAGSLDHYLNTYETEEGVKERLGKEYAFKALYLADKGETVETKTREVHSEKARSEMLEAVLDLFEEEDVWHTPQSELHEKYADDIKRTLMEHGRTEEQAEKMVAKKGGMFGFGKLMSRLYNYANEPASTTETVTDTKAMEQDIDSRIDEAAYEKWLSELVAGLIKDSGIYNGKDIFTPSGSRRSFKQTHYPVTLDNIAKAMAAQNGGNTKNVSGFVGVKSLRAGTAERFKSVADMHKREGRLKNLTAEENAAIIDALDTRLTDVMGQIYDSGNHKSDSNRWMELDSIGEIMMEITEQPKYTVDSIVKVFDKYGYKLSNQLATDIRDLLFDVSEMPVNIFEAKPERAVRFDEVLAAVVPDTAPAELRAGLEEAGVTVLEYQQNDDADRLAKVNSVEGAKFSLKDNPERKLQRENAKLKEVNRSLREQFEITKFAKVDKKSLQKFAKQLLKDYSSSADLDELTGKLTDVYKFFVPLDGEQNQDAFRYEVAYGEVYDMAAKIIEQAMVIDDTDYRETKHIRDHIRKTGITLAAEDVSDLTAYDSVAEFKKANRGRIKLVKDGVPVDTFFKELADDYPGYFVAEEHTNPADQLMAIEAFLNEHEVAEYNPYKNSMRDATTWLANDIMERFFQLPQAKLTFADKAQQKLQAEKDRSKQKLDKLRTDKNARIAELIRENRESVKKAVLGQRMAGERDLHKLKEKQRAREAKMGENRRKAVLRKRIERHAGDLSGKLLRPTDQKHIPQELQGAVAMLLDSINLSSNYETVYGKDAEYHRVKPGTEPGAEVTKRSQAFARLRDIYEEMAGELVIDPNLLGPDGLLGEVIQMGDAPLADLNVKQLETMWQTIRAVEATITNVNRAFSQDKWAHISEAAEGLRRDNQGKKERAEYRGPAGKAQKLIGLDMMTPETYLHYLGNTGDDIFRIMRNAQDGHIRMMAEIAGFTEKTMKDVDVKALEREIHTVTLGGEKVKLSTAQLMELYVLSRREQATAHIYEGGILPDDVSSKGIRKITKAKPVRGVTLEEVSAAVGMLTDEQVKIAEKLQGFASKELSAYGNSASMQVYNYEKFLEKNYWPIRVNKQETKSDVEKDTQTVATANKGFTRGTKPNANNSVRIGSIFDTFSTHASEMATYAAWLAPMEDINRIRNFTFRDEEKRTEDTVKGIIETVHGKNGSAYLQKLLQDITNGVKGTHGETAYMGGITGNFKAASVGANLRVIIQQPTAILRAADMIDVKYLASGMKPAGGWKKAVKYAPIAQWKDWGYFDINTGRQMKDVLFDTDSTLDKVKNASMWGAGKMDSLSWGMLWNAVESETKDTRKELQPGSEAYYEAVAARFTEVVDHTQVVDGILQRSQIMRSGDGLTKMATSFMGEPTKQYNMVMQALYDGLTYKGALGKEAKRHLARTALTLAISGVVNAMAQSIMDAVRDDDKEKEYWEKWQAAFADNAVDTFNPAGYVPFVKDILSIIQGYDVSRMDMDSIADVVSAAQNMYKSLNGEGKYTLGSASANLFATTAKLIGLPVANLKREIKSFAMLAALESDNYVLQYRMEKASLSMNYSGNKSTFMDILYRVYVNAPEAYEIIYADLLKEDKLKTEDKTTAEVIASAMENRMKKAQGTTKVSELEQRYLSPDQQTNYDRKMGAIQGSSVWRSATSEQKKEVEADVYDLITDGFSDKTQEKIDAGAAYGVSDTDYILYKLALSMVDEPTEKGKLGSYTNAEVEAAIELLGLDDEASSYLWQAQGKNEKSNPWK